MASKHDITIILITALKIDKLPSLGSVKKDRDNNVLGCPSGFLEVADSFCYLRDQISSGSTG